MAGEETHEALVELDRLRGKNKKVNFHAHAGEPIKVPLRYQRGGLQMPVGEVLIYPDGSFAGEIIAKQEVEALLSTRRIEYLSIVWDRPV